MNKGKKTIVREISCNLKTLGGKQMRKIWNNVSSYLIIGVLIFILTGCSQGKANNASDPINTPSVEEETNSSEVTEVKVIETTPTVTMIIKDYGTITLELYPEMAPNTVNNFITLANDGFYDGLIFHRVIKDFMIQGGDPDGIGSGGPGYSIAGEFAINGFKQNTLSHTKGIISMARTNIPDSAGSQFFIMSEDGTYLDGQYAAFGKVTSGIEIVEAIEKVETNNSDKPVKDVVIESIRVDTNGVEVPEVLKVAK